MYVPYSGNEGFFSTSTQDSNYKSYQLEISTQIPRGMTIRATSMSSLPLNTLHRGNPPTIHRRIRGERPTENSTTAIHWWSPVE